jgi:hypothetical protein
VTYQWQKNVQLHKKFEQTASVIAFFKVQGSVRQKTLWKRTLMTKNVLRHQAWHRERKISILSLGEEIGIQKHILS